MTKLLVSDYDDTLYTNNINIYLNVEAIKKFKSNGHKFVIATGRNFDSIIKMINKYKIPYDYLICNDGSIIFDNNNEILFAHYLKNYEISDILEYLRFKKQYIMRIELYNERSSTDNFKNILEVASILKPFKNVKNLVTDMNDSLDNIDTYKFNNYLFSKKFANKSTAIKKLIEIIDMNEDDVYTVGDNINDVEMIRDYNGYNMLISSPSLYKNSNGVVLSVKQLIKKINK